MLNWQRLVEGESCSITKLTFSRTFLRIKGSFGKVILTRTFDSFWRDALQKVSRIRFNLTKNLQYSSELTDRRISSLSRENPAGFLDCWMFQQQKGKAGWRIEGLGHRFFDYPLQGNQHPSERKEFFIRAKLKFCSFVWWKTKVFIFFQFQTGDIWLYFERKFGLNFNDAMHFHWISLEQRVTHPRPIFSGREERGIPATKAEIFLGIRFFLACPLHRCLQNTLQQFG